jgi:hypothetical protein
MQLINPNKSSSIANQLRSEKVYLRSFHGDQFPKLKAKVLNRVVIFIFSIGILALGYALRYWANLEFEIALTNSTQFNYIETTKFNKYIKYDR